MFPSHPKCSPGVPALFLMSEVHLVGVAAGEEAMQGAGELLVYLSGPGIQGPQVRAYIPNRQT